MRNIDAVNHVSGKSVYLDDIIELQGTLFALPFDLPSAHAENIRIELTEAMALKGVVTILTEHNIPGENQIGGIIPDEPLFAGDAVHFWGQVLGIIIAESEFICRQARKLIRFQFDELPVVTCPRDAHSKNLLICPPRTFAMGDVYTTWKDCAHIISDRVEINGQEHLYGIPR